VKISLKERKVVARIEEGLMLKDSAKHPHANRQDVLNGIAYDQTRKLFVVTGKKWPRYYVTMLDLIK
jgi:glutamine cyclotransferase